MDHFWANFSIITDTDRDRETDAERESCTMPVCLHVFRISCSFSLISFLPDSDLQIDGIKL